jgi:hypothetical protein
MARRVLDRDRSALADPEQRETLEPGGVDDHLEVARPGIGRHIDEGAIREPGAAQVVAQQREFAREVLQPGAPGEATPLVLEVVEPRSGHHQRRAAPAHRISDARAVEARAKSHLLAHMHHTAPD